MITTIDARPGAAVGLSAVGVVISVLLVVAMTGAVSRWCEKASIEVDMARVRWVSLVSAAPAGFAVMWFDQTPVAIVWVAMLPWVVVAAVIDAATQRIPTPLLWWASGATVCASVVAAGVGDGMGEAARAVVIGVAMSGALFVVAVVTKGQVGMADVRLAFPLGVASGWVSWSAAVWSTLLLPVLLLFPVAVVLLVSGRGHRGSTLAAGPAMVVAALVVFVAVRV